jgi:amino acid adenylation domain-containing protein
MSNLPISGQEMRPRPPASLVETPVRSLLTSSLKQEELLAYWRQHLAHLPLLTLPTDRPFRLETEPQNQASLAFTLPEQLLETLIALSQREHVTLFTIMLAGFQLLLARYSEQKDIVVQTSGMEEGLTLVMRTDLGESLTVRELLERVRAIAVEAHAHAVPAISLHEFPLQVALHYSTHTDAHRMAHGVPEDEAPLFPARLLDLSLVMTGTVLEGTLQFNADLFDLATMQRLLGHYQVILENMAADLGQSCWQIPLLSVEELHQLLFEWNTTITAYPKDQCIHQLFEAQVARTPREVATLFQDQQLTYEELDERANQLAHYLQRLGVGPEVLVGLCVERGPEMIIALLAILKAGGAYVPLDPAYPLDRLAFLIEDARMPILLTKTGLVKQLPTSPTQLIYLDQLWEAITSERKSRLSTDTCSDNLAYVIYTSGSTGKPKGVAVTHRNVVRVVKETNYLPFTPDSVFLQLVPISFDVSTLEIWGSLLNGARLVIAPPAMPSLEDLGALLQHYQVTVLWLTAGLFHMMVENRLDGLSSVKYLIAGGDTLSAVDVQKVIQNLPACQMINGYGPTESTTLASYYRATDPGQIETTVPIGRPLANTQVYILDRYLQPVPIGVAGELYIGGDGLARCYLNRPELTSEKFLPDPFSKEPGARLYSTGDLARYRANGDIEFLGRNDDQVKVRGFRIELGEIETVLREHPAVRNGVVVARRDTSGQNQLLAYLVLDAEQGADIDNVRAFIKQRLPAYMLPAAFILLDQLPVTANGKVDRRSLPDPGEIQAEGSTEVNEARDELEEVLVEIWSSALDLKNIDIFTSFFALGGNSLLAMQMVSRVFKLFQLKVPLQRFFQRPTVSALAQVLTEIEPRPGRVRKIASVIQRVKKMTAEEKQQLLENQKQKTGDKQ